MRLRGRVRDQAGFSYLILLLWMAIAGALLSALGPSWHMHSRREREAEYVFRAEQYRQAITAYAAPINVNGCANLQQLPTRLEDLLEDRRCGIMRRHLRRRYADPITGSLEWGLVVAPGGGIQGIHSRSRLPIVRKLQGVKTYEDWVFAVGQPATSWPGGFVPPPTAPK